MRLPMRHHGAKLACFGLAFFLVSRPAEAVSLILISSADASLMEVSPGNSNGGEAYTLSGRTQNGAHARALYRFDFSRLPTNAIVSSAVLQLDCTRRSGEGMCVADVAFGLHRVLRAWGEGTNVATINPGQGSPASPGDATWSSAFNPTNAWSAPGGQAGVDFSPVESSFQFITTPAASPYLFESTPELVDDVQTWVNQPQLNLGWVLIANPEDTYCTARRFNSRENPNSQPRLQIDCRVPPRIEAAAHTGSQFHLRFTPWPGQSYVIEYRTTLAVTNWQTLTNLGVITNSTPILIHDTAGVLQRYYRISMN